MYKPFPVVCVVHVIRFQRFGGNPTLQLDHYNVQTVHPQGHQSTVFNSMTNIQVGGKLARNGRFRIEPPFTGVIAELTVNHLRMLDLAAERDPHVTVRGDVQLITGVLDRNDLQRMHQVRTESFANKHLLLCYEIYKQTFGELNYLPDLSSITIMDYPQRARDALSRIENLIVQKKQDHVLDLISDFIFFEKKSDLRKYGNTHKNNQICGLSLIQEFQLVVVLCEFYERPGQEMTRNAIFLSLFEGSNSSRLKVLTKLISTAIASSVAPILMSAGTWIQQLGPTNLACLELSQQLIEDFIVFSLKGAEQLKNLPAISPRFSINFLACCTDLYLNDSKTHELLPPPPPLLLEIFTNWILDYPKLCTEQQSPLVLPQGAISMPIVNPLPGLIRWCVLAPISSTPTNEIAYSKLHLAILQSIMQESKAPTELPSASAINSISLGVVVFALKYKATEITNKKGNADTDQKMQLSLERLAQCMQVALQARSLSGNVSQLMCRLKTLPQNDLLNIVIKSHSGL